MSSIVPKCMGTGRGEMFATDAAEGAIDLTAENARLERQLAEAKKATAALSKPVSVQSKMSLEVLCSQVPSSSLT